MRKVCIDFRIPITFRTPIAILPRVVAETGLACAVGTIGYNELDEGSALRDLPSLFEATKEKLEEVAAKPGFTPLAI